MVPESSQVQSVSPIRIGLFSIGQANTSPFKAGTAWYSSISLLSKGNAKDRGLTEHTSVYTSLNPLLLLDVQSSVKPDTSCVTSLTAQDRLNQ
jgi:hypothetical protein